MELNIDLIKMYFFIRVIHIYHLTCAITYSSFAYWNLTTVFKFLRQKNSVYVILGIIYFFYYSGVSRKTNSDKIHRYSYNRSSSNSKGDR